MNERGKRQASSIFGGMGFYIALLVCVLAAGVVGYYALQNTPDTPSDDSAGGAGASQTVDTADPGPSAPVTNPDPEPVLPVTGNTPPHQTAPVSTAPDPDGAGEEPGASGSSLPLGTSPGDDLDLTAPEDTVSAMAPEDSIPAQEPLVVTAPLAGETVAVFSVDQLTYNATMNDWRTHDGIDIQAAAGTAVAAAAAGTVTAVVQDDRLGTTVTIDHGSGYVTTYGSLQPEVSVSEGDTVTAGAVIGAVGNTSLVESALGAHLHFAVEKDGQAMDPGEFLRQ